MGLTLMNYFLPAYQRLGVEKYRARQETDYYAQTFAGTASCSFVAPIAVVWTISSNRGHPLFVTCHS